MPTSPTQDPLRPTSLEDFTGQLEVRTRLDIILSAAQEREQLPDHMLFVGPPGRGKTTLAGIVANTMGLELVTTSGPALEKPGDVVGLLMSLRRPSAVFIDELHGLSRKLEELLYPPMEDGVVDMMLGEGNKARALRVPLEPFVLLGATTQAGRISAPLRDRFGYIARLRAYSVDELAAITQRSATLLGLALTEGAARAIAARSQGTPRIANARVRRVRDYAQAHAPSTGSPSHPIDEELAVAGLEEFGVDALGLDEIQQQLLNTIVDVFHGGPVGISNLGAAVNESPSTLEEMYEPYLIQTGLIARTPRGRIAMPAAYTYLGRAVPAGLTVSLQLQPPTQDATQPALDLDQPTVNPHIPQITDP